MKLKPRKMSATFFSAKELSLSIFQGLAIAAGALILYFQSMKAGITESEVRTLVFTTILLSNILLTLVNRSFYYSLFTTLKYKNRLIPLIILISLAVLAVSLFVAPVRDLFQFEMLSYKQMFISLFTSAVAVLWIEIYKWIIRMKKGRYLYPEANY